MKIILKIKLKISVIFIKKEKIILKKNNFLKCKLVNKIQKNLKKSNQIDKDKKLFLWKNMNKKEKLKKINNFL